MLNNIKKLNRHNFTKCTKKLKEACSEFQVQTVILRNGDKVRVQNSCDGFMSVEYGVYWNNNGSSTSYRECDIVEYIYHEL